MDPIIPKSPNGGLDPQLRARITSATAAVAEYTAETDNWIAGRAEQPAWQSWSWRLHTELRMILAAIGDATS